MLTALLIFSAVAGALYAGFNQGLRLWKKTMEPDPRWDQALFIERFKTSFRNALAEEKQGMEGSAQSIRFLTRSLEMRFQDGQEASQAVNAPARIRYFFDDSRKAVIEQTEFYEKILSPDSEQPIQEKIALEGVTAFKIEYYQRAGRTMISSPLWVGKWKRSCLPEAVKITVESGEKTTSRMTRVISFPGAGVCSEPEKV